MRTASCAVSVRVICTSLHRRVPSSLPPLRATAATAPQSAHSQTHWTSAPPLRRGFGYRQTSSTSWQPARGTGAAGGAETPAISETPAIILGIETSCDDTGAAVVSSDGKVLGEALASQMEIHAPWGGVVPKLAMRAHADNIDSVVDEALRAAGLGPEDLTAVAVTIGPGLSLCLRVGVLKARQLAAVHQLRVVPVHHMEAHALVARLTAGPGSIEFPFVALLVSGGHNLLLLVRGVGRYTLLGTTVDDAIGEAYDKTARLLGLDLLAGGGPALEAAARDGDPKRFPFSVPMRKNATCDFSYAGLKTAVRLVIEEQLGIDDKPGAVYREPPRGGEGDGGGEGSRAAGAAGNGSGAAGEGAGEGEDEDEAGVVGWGDDPGRDQIRRDISAGFQVAAVKHLEERTRRALEWALEEEPSVRTLVVAGGVAANQAVRASLQAVAEGAGVELVCPPPRLCTDNGVMVAWTGVERLELGLWEEPPATPLPAEDEYVDLRPRWPLGEKDARAIQKARGLKTKRQHRNLTELTEEELGMLG